MSAGTEHIDQLLVEYAFDTLDAAERSIADAHLASCARCRRELDEITEAAALVALAEPPIDPPHGGADRLLAAVDALERRAGLAADIATLFDLDAGFARRLLRDLDDLNRWQPGPGRGVHLWPLEPGAKFAREPSMLLRLEPGATFPHHRHIGEEHILILQGACREPDGTRLAFGQRANRAAGTAHAFTADADGPVFIAAVRCTGGVEID